MVVIEMAIERVFESQRRSGPAQVKRRENASKTIDRFDGRHAIGWKAQPLKKAGGGNFGGDLTRPAVLHFDLLAAFEPAVKLGRRAARLARQKGATRQMRIDHTGIRIGVEVERGTLKRIRAQDPGARQRFVSHVALGDRRRSGFSV